jgi:hypothetical protein
MQKTRSIFLGFMACCLVTSFIACKKDSKTGESETTPAQDNTLAESNYNDANNMIDAAAALGVGFSFRTETGANVARLEDVLGACAKVAVDTTSATRNITIDFGTTDCTCVDFKKRRGKIIATWTGTRYRDAGTVITISFDNYFVNGNQIMGTHKTTNLGPNTAGNLVFKIEVNGSIVKANNGGTITWSSIRQREWTAGANTPVNILDDVYSITGSANGTTAGGIAYAISINQPLIYKIGCYWFQSGVVTLTPAGGAAWTLDYGNGVCDPNATLTYSGKSYSIILF